MDTDLTSLAGAAALGLITASVVYSIINPYDHSSRTAILGRSTLYFFGFSGTVRAFDLQRRCESGDMEACRQLQAFPDRTLDSRKYESKL